MIIVMQIEKGKQSDFNDFVPAFLNQPDRKEN